MEKKLDDAEKAVKKAAKKAKKAAKKRRNKKDKKRNKKDKKAVEPPDEIRERYNWAFLKTWNDVFGDELFLTQPLIIPVNEFDDSKRNGLPDDHWFLIVLDYANGKLYHLDSAIKCRKSTKRWCKDFLKLFTIF